MWHWLQAYPIAKNRVKSEFTPHVPPLPAKRDASSSVHSLNPLGNLIVKREHLKKKFGSRRTRGVIPIYVDVTIDMPIGNSPLASAVKRKIVEWLWYGEEVPDIDKMAKSSASEMIQTSAKQFGEEDCPHSPSFEFSIKKTYETSKIVTFELDGY